VKFYTYKQIPIADLKPYEKNPRTHSAGQIEQIRKSIREFGFTNPILVDEDGLIVAGHGRLQAAQAEGLLELPAIVMDGLTAAQKRALVIADNQIAVNAGWDADLLREQLEALQEEHFDLSLVGFSEQELEALLATMSEGLTDPDDVPAATENPITVLGDVWLLGKHRVMCGDSTSMADVSELMAGERAQLIHADPPYGMGKESDGVLNDNLYADKLDTFQMAWRRAFRPHAEDNASAYIWGNAEGLWRLWFVGGLKDSERLTMRNEIVWDKGGSGFGVGTEAQRCYFPEERCLFFMLGEQGFNNNADNYWDGWEPIRSYLAGEMEKCGGAKNWKAALGNSMGSHYFTKSQWCFPTAAAYKKLQAFGSAFEREYEPLKREYDELKREYDELKREFYATRAYFDNTHDNMTDVWDFPRVQGDERHGHATPKPVSMMERVMLSSCPPGGLVVEPFGGSGSTLIGAEKTNRRCYSMELQPQYVDVAIKRWQNFTGKAAVLASSGKTYDELVTSACEAA